MKIFQLDHMFYQGVIIAARNEEKYIEKCVNSLKGQNYEGDWELIVVDDRSCDNTLYTK